MSTMLVKPLQLLDVFLMTLKSLVNKYVLNVTLENTYSIILVLMDQLRIVKNTITQVLASNALISTPSHIWMTTLIFVLK